MSSSNADASAGLMIRDSFSQNAATASVYVTPAGGSNAVVKFTSRNRTGDSSVTVTGPTVTLPIFLRLSKSGDTVTGLYSTDNQSYAAVGSYTQSNAMPPRYAVGINVSSSDASLNSAEFRFLSFNLSVPQQQGGNLMAWYRSDSGVVSSGGSISSWQDQSGNGNTFTQSNPALRPTLLTGQINNGVLPSVSFDASQQQHLTFGSNFADLSAGCSMFLVIKPASGSTGTPCSFGNAGSIDAVYPRISGANASLNVFAGTTGSSVSTTSGPISSSQYQLLEEILQPGQSPGTAIGTILVDGVQQAQSNNLQNANSVTRTNNAIGAGIGPSDYFSGQLAEVLVYKAPLTSSQRASVENYILSKFGVGATPTLAAPTFSPDGGVFTAAQSVILNQEQSAPVYFTINGANPSVASSQWFSTPPITLNQQVTIRAMAAAPFFNNSSVSTATFKVEQNTLPVARNGLVCWLRADNATTSGNAVSSWQDISGSSNSAAQTNPSNRPTVTLNSVNGQPSIDFNGSQFLQLSAGMSDFSAGATLLVVLRSPSVTAGARIVDLGNGASSDNLQLQQPGNTSIALFAFNGSTPSSLSSPNATVLNNFQLVEALHDGINSARILTNAVQGAQSSSMNAFNVIARNNNFIGQGSSGGNTFTGQIAELLLYNRQLTVTELADVEGYLFSRYNVVLANTTPAPKISVPGGTLPGPTQVALSAATPSAEIFFTVNGTTPDTTTSPRYVQPLNIYYSQTLKTIAVDRGVQSSVSSAIYQLDPGQWTAPSTGDPTQLNINIKLPTVAVPQ